MIDGFKILNLPVNITELKKNKFLEFTGNHNTNTGEYYDYPLFAKFNGLEFLIRDNSKEIKKNPNLKHRIYVNLNGSIHKYFNNGLHNYNDFYYSDLLNAVIDLCEKFKINPCITILNNVEFGVNIIVPFDINDFLNSVISYGGKQFHPFNIEGAKGIECTKTDFYIKIYNKSLRYELSENILRFEIKVRKMKFFEDKKINIKYLSDLLNPDLFLLLGAVLKSVFNEILLYDYSINETNLNDKERLILSNGRNAKFWEQLKPDSVKFSEGNKDNEYKKQRKKYYRQLDSYKKTLNKYSTLTIQKDVSELIEKKHKELANFNENLRDKLTDFLNSFENKKRDKLTDLENNQKTTEKGQINTSNIVQICPIIEENIKRECLTCKNDISHKKKNAKFCSKKCKNDYTNPFLNPKNNFKKRLEKINADEKLFDDKEFFRYTEYQLNLLAKENSIYNKHGMLD